MSHKAVQFNSVQEMVEHYHNSNHAAAQAVFFAGDRPQEQPHVMQPIITDPQNVLKTDFNGEQLAKNQAMVKAAEMVQVAAEEVTRLENAKQTPSVKDKLKKAKSALTKALNKYVKLKQA